MKTVETQHFKFQNPLFGVRYSPKVGVVTTAPTFAFDRKMVKNAFYTEGVYFVQKTLTSPPNKGIFMRYFNTSGPNIVEEHYTLMRPKLVAEGKLAVHRSRYFTIWAPRQTGKSTYFKLLGEQLVLEGYKVAYVNFESYRNQSLEDFLIRLNNHLTQFWEIPFTGKTLASVFTQIESVRGEKLVLIIDEVEGINVAYFSDVLHAIRNAYHSRTYHCLKSVVLVGVTNILGD
jgi:hypothetical protein